MGVTRKHGWSSGLPLLLQAVLRTGELSAELQQQQQEEEVVVVRSEGGSRGEGLHLGDMDRRRTTALPLP